MKSEWNSIKWLSDPSETPYNEWVNEVSERPGNELVSEWTEGNST